MTITEYLEILSNDSPNPCYFLDTETNEILYVNQMFHRKFQLFDEYEGKKCDVVLREITGSCALCEDLDIKHGEFLEHRVLIKNLNTYLRSNSTLINVQNKEILMTKFFLTSSDVEISDVEHSFEEAMAKCLDFLSIKDQQTAIHSYLQLLCEFYHCRLAYICEFNSETKELASKYVWSSLEGSTEIPKEQKNVVSVAHFVEWLENDNDRKLIDLSDSGDYDASSTEAQILDKYKISNIILNKLWDKDGSLMGIVGISDRSQPIYDDRLIKAVSHIVVERFNEQSLVNALNSLSEMDLLTGFFNRTKYTEKLTALHKNSPKRLGVLFVNLNSLRKTNEYFGFEVGDEHIKSTSYTLREFFSNDFYRISGDEFVSFIADIDEDEFESKVMALHDKLKESNTETSFAIGHAWDSGNYSISELVKVADTVMTVNKQVFYSNNFSDRKEIGNALLQELLQAVVEDEFMVYLQPQIDLATDKIVAAEALIRRFDKKQQKMIFPDQFIPLYEKNSIIRHVDLFVVRKVCQLIQDWRHVGKTLPIAVNLSRVTLMEHGIVQTISNILDEYNVSHDLIIIEITERIGLVENDVASSLVESFRAHGFRLSLDDFGCAYSNIITLAKIDVEEVKIDKSLVDHIVTNRKNKNIVENMIRMVDSFDNTHTLAEGIETTEQADALRDVNCSLGQGYLYSRPIPNEEFFEKYIKN